MTHKAKVLRRTCWLAVGAVVCGAAVATARAGTGEVPLPLLAADEAPASVAQQQLNQVVTSYLAAQKLLAADKFDGVGTELKKLKAAAASLAERGDAKVKQQASAVAKAADPEPKDLKRARESFKPLSAAVIGLVETLPPTADATPTLYEATCPMAKADWLQGSRDIVNPYFGKEMLDCGEVKKEIKPAVGEKK